MYKTRLENKIFNLSHVYRVWSSNDTTSTVYGLSLQKLIYISGDGREGTQSNESFQDCPTLLQAFSQYFL